MSKNKNGKPVVAREVKVGPYIIHSMVNVHRNHVRIILIEKLINLLKLVFGKCNLMIFPRRFGRDVGRQVLDAKHGLVPLVKLCHRTIFNHFKGVTVYNI